MSGSMDHAARASTTRPRARHRRRWHGVKVIVALIIVSFILLKPTSAAAHPLGNFTINLYSRLSVGAQEIDVYYVVDMAEIPTYQQFNGPPDATTATEFLTSSAPRLRDGLRLRVDGKPVPLDLFDQTISFPPGQGGLALTRIELQLRAAVPQLTGTTQRDIAYEDTNYDDRIGWREIVVQPTANIAIASSDVAAQDRSDALRAYPQDMLTSPLNIRSARATVQVGAATSPLQPAAQPVGQRPVEPFAALIAIDQLGPLAIAAALLAAVGLGALHALSPGHGKTIVAMYLVGARSTARHALFLGFTVTATHTLGVFALGLITLYASRYILAEQLYPWLSLTSGAIVVVMGLSLLRQRLRGMIGRRSRMDQITPHDHDHSHDHDHTHDHDHDHDHSHAHRQGGRPHSHLPPGADGAPVTWRSLLAMGISGGMVPCPSALVVMLGAISLSRVGLGLLLIVAFSLGLAGVLSGLGVLFIHGSRWLSHIAEGATRGRMALGLRVVPVISAIVVTTAGLVITMRALAQTGLIR